MNKFSGRTIQRCSAAAPLLLLLGAAGGLRAEVIAFYIKNVDSQPVTVKMLTEGSNCYEGDVPLGQIWQVAAGQYVKIMLSRVGGHGCDGRQGEFAVEFKPGAGDNYTTQHFDFSNDGGLELTRGYANPYPGKLVQGARVTTGNSYTYTTFQQPAVTAGQAIGMWSKLCQQICDYSQSDARTTENTRTRTYTEQEKRAIETSLTSSLEFKGVGSLSGTIKTSWEKSVGQSMSDQVRTGQTLTDTRTYAYSHKDMADLHIFAVWQWIAITHLSNGELVTVRSLDVTCTPDGYAPQYPPNSPEDRKACRGDAR